MTDSIEIRREGAWLVIWLNRPDVRNALSTQMVDDLIGALQNARDDDQVRGVTLRGKGAVFCAGGDLKQFKSLLQSNADRADTIASNLRAGELFDAVARCPKPVIALVNGAAMAGGLGLACAADVVVVTRDARFALTETRLGIVPAQIAPHVVRRIGQARARRIMLTGATFRGDEAVRLGIADVVVEDRDGLDGEEQRLRADILRCAPHATAVTKALIADIAALGGEALRRRAAEDFAHCLLGDEGSEGVAAFVEKRAPAWAPPEAKP